MFGAVPDQRTGSTDTGRDQEDQLQRNQKVSATLHFVGWWQLPLKVEGNAPQVRLLYFGWIKLNIIFDHMKNGLT